MKKSDSAFWEWNSVYNKNVSWVDHKGVWAVYIAFITLARGLLIWVRRRSGGLWRPHWELTRPQFPITPGTAWTIVHLSHAIVRPHPHTL